MEICLLEYYQQLFFKYLVKLFYLFQIFVKSTEGLDEKFSKNSWANGLANAYSNPSDTSMKWVDHF